MTGIEVLLVIAVVEKNKRLGGALKSGNGIPEEPSSILPPFLQPIGAARGVCRNDFHSCFPHVVDYPLLPYRMSRTRVFQHVSNICGGCYGAFHIVLEHHGNARSGAF